MKIIVCGAGNVGRSIVSYLILGNNDIVVIDKDPVSLNALAKEFDIQPVLGTASHPDVLERAGAAETDMLVAVTNNDEVNMVSCEIGAALFNIPKKIARIDSQDLLSPLWGGLFNEKHIPIDLVISPSIFIAKEIAALLKTPGMSSAVSLLKGKLNMLAFRCPSDKNEQWNIRQLENLLPNINIRIFCIIHNGNSFIPTSEYKIKQGDLVYFLTLATDSDTVIRELELEKSTIEKLVIFGGNEVSRYLAAEMEKDDNILSCKIIEDDPIVAKNLAKGLKSTAIINGDLMSDVILEEAGLERCDAAVSVLYHDKDNLLMSLVAKQHKVPLSLSLVNATCYNNFIENISDSILIDGSSVIISSMLQELRKARIRDAYSLGHNFGEVWEIIISEDNINIGQQIKNIEMPTNSYIGAICRKDNIFFPDEETIIEAGDILILYVGVKGIKKAEKLFA